MAAQEDVRIHHEQVSPAESSVHGFKLFLSASGIAGRGGGGFLLGQKVGRNCNSTKSTHEPMFN